MFFNAMFVYFFTFVHVSTNASTQQENRIPGKGLSSHFMDMKLNGRLQVYYPWLGTAIR